MIGRGLRSGIAAVAGGVCLAYGSVAAGQILVLGADGGLVRSEQPLVRIRVGPQRPVRNPVYADTVSFAPNHMAEAMRESAKRHAVPASIIEAVAWQESRFNQSAISPKGARGVMQLMPGTASFLGVDARNMKSNIDGGTAYLSQQLRRYGDLRLALAAYNAGPGAVDRYGDVPPYAETQGYVEAILAHLESVGAVSEREEALIRTSSISSAP